MQNLSDKKERRLGVLISYASMIIGIAVALLYTPYKLKMLGGSPDEADIEFGLSSFVDSITTWFAILSTSMSVSYIRFATIRQKEKGEKGLGETNGVYFLFYLFCLVLSVFVGFVFYVLLRFQVIPLSGYSDSQKEIILNLFLISLGSLSVTLLFTVFTNFLNLRQKFVYLHSVSLLISLSVPLISLPFLQRGCDVQVLSIISLLINFFFQICNCAYALFAQKERISFHFDKSTRIFAKQIIVFSCFLLFNTIVDQIDSRIDKTILGFMAPPDQVAGPSQVTLYELGQTFVTYLNSASIAAISVFVPTINSLVVAGDKDSLSRLFLKVSRFQMLIVCTIVGGYWFCGKSFVVAWVGAEKIDSFYIGAVLLSLSAVPFTESVAVEVQRAMDKHKFRALVFFISAILNVVLSILFVYLFPRDKAVYACLLGTAITYIPSKWVIMNWYNRTRIGLPMKQYWFLLLSFALVTGGAVGMSYLTGLALPKVFSWKWTEFLVKGLIFCGYQFLGMLLLNWKAIKQWRNNKKHPISFQPSTVSTLSASPSSGNVQETKNKDLCDEKDKDRKVEG